MLKEKLEAIKAAARTRIPPEAQAVMQRAIDDTRASGILDRVVKAGERARTSRCRTPAARRSRSPRCSRKGRSS